MSPNLWGLMFCVVGRMWSRIRDKDSIACTHVHTCREGGHRAGRLCVTCAWRRLHALGWHAGVCSVRSCMPPCTQPHLPIPSIPTHLTTSLGYSPSSAYSRNASGPSTHPTYHITKGIRT